MQIMSYSDVRANFKQVCDDVCKNHDITVVTRSSGEPVVLMSLQDYTSMKTQLQIDTTTKL